MAGAALFPAPLAAQSADAARFAAPAEPMRLTRVLERALGDGNAVTVTRSWRVRFVPRGNGYRVEGQPIAVEVDVPPRLAPLAEVERARDDDTFPILLDAAGLIVSARAGEPPSISGLAEAANAVLEELPEDRRASGMAYVRAIQQAGERLASSWPEDLFVPLGAPRSSEQVLPLPDGRSGRLAVHFAGTLDPAGRRLSRAERRIVTRIGDSVRTSRETWELAPL